MKVLIIGGTRNIGYFLAKRLNAEGHQVTILNRGVSQDNLPETIARLRCDRTDRNQLRRALEGREFDMVVDMVLFKGAEAEAITDILQGRVGHFIFVSTGQVYLVRDGITRPFREEDYAGPLMPQPEANTYDYEEWLYGVDKRAVEDTLAEAHARTAFPYTSLRLPMVNSERDSFKRLYGYVLRINDGGPILVPEKPGHAVRNVYVGDVVDAILRVLNTGQGKGRAYNISQDETYALPDLLDLLGQIIGRQPHIEIVSRELLKANGFLPDCSPFSDRWMSELDNTRSKQELGVTYTPAPIYLEKIIHFYEKNPPEKPTSYRRRHAEKNLVLSP